MSDQHAKAKSLGGSSRINDGPLAFGLKMYTHKAYGRDEERLWVWTATEYCSGPVLAKITDVSIKDLEKMKRVIDEQIRTIREWEEADAAAQNTDQDEAA